MSHSNSLENDEKVMREMIVVSIKEDLRAKEDWSDLTERTNEQKERSSW